MYETFYFLLFGGGGGGNKTFVLWLFFVSLFVFCLNPESVLEKSPQFQVKIPWSGEALSHRAWRLVGD